MASPGEAAPVGVAMAVLPLLLERLTAASSFAFLGASSLRVRQQPEREQSDDDSSSEDELHDSAMATHAQETKQFRALLEKFAPAVLVGCEHV